MSEETAGRPRRHPVLRWLARLLGLALFGALLYVLVRQGRKIDWTAVLTAITGLPPLLLLAAAVMAVTSHGLYAVFDLLGRRYTGHHLPARRVLLVGATSYAVNLNLGTLLGGVGVRARLYTRLGLDAGRVARIVTFAMVSNWMGYLVLAGGLFVLVPPALPPGWELGTTGLRWIGVGLLLLAAVYLGLCARHGGHEMRLRGQPWPVPPLRLALAQVGVSVAHWATMGGLLTLLFEGRLPYLQVLAVLLIAAIAGVLTHVPAGLGVIEAVFVALLSYRLAPHLLLAGLVLYRAMFYLAPLVVATAVYLHLEARRPRRPAGR